MSGARCDCPDCRPTARGAWLRLFVWAAVLVGLIVSGGALASDCAWEYHRGVFAGLNAETAVPPAWPWMALFAVIGLLALAGLVQVLNFIARRAGHDA